MYYLKYFFITSIFGYILETLVCKGYESGILYGPWTPIYGIGSIIIIISSDKILKKRNINGFLKFVILFIFCFCILTLAELVGGLLIERIFGYSFWDYTNHKFNVGKYICLEISLIWGTVSILFVCIRPIIDKIIKYIPNIIIYLAIPLLIIDICCTFILKR
jgi:uncharacterized membrane protein